MGKSPELLVHIRGVWSGTRPWDLHTSEGTWPGRRGPGGPRRIRVIRRAKQEVDSASPE
jgi:hypothetical protein